jgi:hypothetical protein
MSWEYYLFPDIHDYSAMIIIRIQSSKGLLWDKLIE